MASEHEDRLMSTKEVMNALGVGRTKFYYLQRQGLIPKPIRLGTRTTRWRASDIQKLIASGFVEVDAANISPDSER